MNGKRRFALTRNGCRTTQARFGAARRWVISTVAGLPKADKDLSAMHPLAPLRHARLLLFIDRK
ncbi:MAG: hypothetical protein E6R07_05770 [Nevskiaceae bacterium]|nr:MAG: hypothetical protein E6R07_05770 [Nevskiaceae bacterium]